MQFQRRKLRFGAACATVLAFGITILAAPLHAQYVYVALSDSTIAVERIEPNGTLSQVGSPVAAQPGFGSMVVSPAAAGSASKYLYVLTRNLTTNFVGLISGYAIDSHGGLTPIGSTSIDATAPVTGFALSLAADPLGRDLYAGLYIGLGAQGNPIPYRIGSGGDLTVLPATTFNGSRDYYLAIDPGGKYLYAEYYSGTNATSVYETRINSDGTLTSLGSVAAGHNALPMLVEPLGRFLYLSNNPNLGIGPITGNILEYKIGSDGRLTPLGSTAAAQETIRYMAVDPDGKFLYASVYPDTGGSHIQVYRIGSDGGLTRVGSPLGQGGPLAADPAGNFLYELVGNAVVEYRTLPNGKLDTIGSLALNVAPTGLVISGCQTGGNQHPCHSRPNLP